MQEARQGNGGLDADSREVSFNDLFDLAEIQRIQDEFANATGVASIITHPDGTPITKASNFTRFCSQVIRKTEKGCANCYKSDAVIGRENPEGPIVQHCLSGGLWDAGASIVVGGRHIANWLIGQVRDETQTEEGMRAYAREIGADENELIQAFREVPAMTRRQFELVAQALFTLAGQLSSSAYQNVQQARYILERQRAEAALRESESLRRAVFESSPIPVVVMEPVTYQFVDCNPAAVRAFGFTTREETLGKTPLDVSTPFQYHGEPSEEAASTYLQRVVQEGAVAFEWRLRRPDGTEWDAEVHLLRFDFNGVLRLQFSLMDITQRKRAEDEKEKLQSQLFQAQKMEAVGRLAGGVAHDFNNMLEVILGYAELARDRSGQDEQLRADLDEIHKAAKRSADLTRQLLAFARRQAADPRVLDINETVQGMLNMLRRLIGENIELVWLPGEQLGPVFIDPSQLDQLLANLCVNARDAIAGAGRLSIETSGATFDEDYCTRHAGSVPGEYILLSVSDDGCGMDRETQAKIFEPLFTTKELGKGTGLGLATVHGIVKQNNGFIQVYSEPGQGTTFRIYLPRHLDKAESRPEQETAPSPMPSGETVLLVEDEPAILRITTQMLHMMGYSVLAADNPVEALRLAREHQGQVDLLMTDVVMPEMNGRDLATALVSMCPDIKRLFMSGYTADVIAHHGVLDEGVQFIQKPFTMKELAVKIRNVLDQE